MGRRMHQDKKIHTHVYFPQYRALTSEKRKYLKPKGPIGTPTTSQNSSTQIKDEKVKLMISVNGFWFLGSLVLASDSDLIISLLTGSVMGSVSSCSGVLSPQTRWWGCSCDLKEGSAGCLPCWSRENFNRHLIILSTKRTGLTLHSPSARSILGKFCTSWSGGITNSIFIPHILHMINIKKLLFLHKRIITFNKNNINSPYFH